MKLKAMTTYSVAAALLLLPSLSHAATATTTNTPAITKTAGVVELTQPLDARKLTQGATIQTRLLSTVRLPDGTKLPAGTALTATVENDSLQGGNVRLALRFTSARLKHGQTVPIKARIVAVATDDYSDGEPGELMVPTDLDSANLSEDVEGVVSGVDLHSHVSSPNSGVFVSKTKSDVKLPDGMQLELALTSGE